MFHKPSTTTAEAECLRALEELWSLDAAGGDAMTAGATVSRHACGGTLLFVRDANGHSFERCSECQWGYDFDSGRASDAGLSVPGPVRLAVA